jgi:hypothetical protein
MGERLGRIDKKEARTSISNVLLLAKKCKFIDRGFFKPGEDPRPVRDEPGDVKGKSNSVKLILTSSEKRFNSFSNPSESNRCQLVFRHIKAQAVCQKCGYEVAHFNASRSYLLKNLI